MMDYKQILIKNENKILYFAKKTNSMFDIISIEVLGKKDYSYWQVEIPISDFKNKDINTTEFDKELHNKLYENNKYQMDGCSCRGDIDIFKDLELDIPNIIKILKTELL